MLLSKAQDKFPAPTRWLTVTHNSDQRDLKALGTYVVHIFAFRQNTKSKNLIFFKNKKAAHVLAWYYGTHLESQHSED